MITVTLRGHKVDEIVSMVKDLRSQGLEQGRDFDFKWKPKIDDWLNDEYTDSSADFYFYTEELATMFTLRYA